MATKTENAAMPDAENAAKEHPKVGAAPKAIEPQPKEPTLGEIIADSLAHKNQPLDLWPVAKGKAFVRVLTVEEAKEVYPAYSEIGRDVGRCAAVVARCVVDEDGKPIFQDAAEVKKLPLRDILAAARACGLANGFGGCGVEA